MSWCNKCHYGSEVCKLLPMGKAGVEMPSIDKKGRPTIEIVEKDMLKCPQCGTVSHEHLFKNPYKPKIYSSEKKKSKKRASEQGKSLKEEVIAITGGDLKAMDYSK